MAQSTKHAKPTSSKRPEPPRLGRVPTKHTHILADLRRQIIKGKLRPGAQLPTYLDLSDTFEASSVTVQRALERLMADGFVVGRGRAGTFVAEHPPHLFRFVLVIPFDEAEALRSGYHTALVREAQRITQAGPRRVDVVFGMDGHVDREAYQLLVGDIKAGRVAGLIFPHSPHLLTQTPLLQAPEIPRVVMLGAPSYPGVTTIHLRDESFYTRGLEFLARRGRRRIALVSAFGPEAKPTAIMEQELVRHGLSIPRYWRIYVNPFHPEGNRNIIHLLMRGPAGERPDALLVSDDNLLEAVTAGLMDAGIDVPRHADVVALCNHPWPTPSLLPVTRLGYNVRALLAKSIELIDLHRQGKKPPAHNPVDAIFEDELASE